VDRKKGGTLLGKRGLQEKGETLKRYLIILGILLIVIPGFKSTGLAWTSQQKQILANGVLQRAYEAIWPKPGTHWRLFYLTTPITEQEWFERLYKFRYEDDTEADLLINDGWSRPMDTILEGYAGDCEDAALLVVAGLWKYRPWVRTGFLFMEGSDLKHTTNHIAVVTMNQRKVHVWDLTLLEFQNQWVLPYKTYLKLLDLKLKGKDWFVVWFDGIGWNM